MLSSIDKLTIALCSCAILVALVFISEGSSVTVTYDSDKCYVYTRNATKSLIVGLFLNLIIFSLYGLVGLCTKIYLSFFLITYVLRVVHTGSFDLLVFVLIILCLFCAKDYIIPSQWVKCIIIILSVFLLGQVYCNFLLQTQWRTISYFKLQYIAEKN